MEAQKQQNQRSGMLPKNAAQLNLQLLFNLMPSLFSLPSYTKLHWKWTYEGYKEKYKNHLCHCPSLSPLPPCLPRTRNYALNQFSAVPEELYNLLNAQWSTVFIVLL